MVKWHLALILTSLSIAGRSGFTEFTYRHSQKERAEDAWKAAGPTGAGPDYKDGWQTGYYDLAMGSNGHVPPVPPKKYWHAKYQNPDGQQCITDWYAGYQDGVIAAEHVGEFEWQLVPSSGVAALPSALAEDYPTIYGSPTASEVALPEPLPTVPPVTAEARRLRHSPQQAWNDAVAAAARPGLDLRMLTGRPAAPLNMNHPGQPHAEVASSTLPAQTTLLAAGDQRHFAPLPWVIIEARPVVGWPAWTDPELPASRSGSSEAIVKTAEPFRLDPSDSQRKPIVVVARPVDLSEPSTTQR